MIITKIVLLFIAGGVFCAKLSAKNSEENVIKSTKEELWDAWKLIYDKSYDSAAEEINRFNKFVKNVDKVNIHNARYSLGLETYTTELNSFADLSWDEFKSVYLGNRQQLRAKPNPDSSDNDQVSIGVGEIIVQDLPATIDWREKGYVTGVKNQGQCGSCRAFSTTGGLEGQHFNATGTLVSLSEQQLVSCDNLCYGCGGGWVEKGYDYLREKGSISEEDYPYNSQWGFSHDCEEEGKPITATVKKYHSLPSGNEGSLQTASATVGPISVAIDASGLFEFYKSGVYYSKWCDPNYLDHAVLVVGYGTYQSPDNNQTEPQDYWLVKNSWGTRWGLDGYIMMSRNRNNNCGIASDALYPIV